MSVDRAALEQDRLAELGYREASAREVRLRDWRVRTEDDPAAFGRLVNVLRATKWARENRERRRATALRWWRVHPEAAAKALARAKARRREAARMRAEVRACGGCGATWCPLPGTRGLAGRGRFCDDRCRQRTRYREDR